jgi:hypothetical protein
MLHLLPMRRLLAVIVGLVALTVLAAVYGGVVGRGNALDDVRWIIQTASISAVLLTLLPYAVWRWVPRLQRVTFPYLGGDWSGKLEFHGPGGAGTREVTLTIRHSLLKVVLILDSAESTSRTLVVHAERDRGLNRDRLYYVYLNERKEGLPGAGDRYRGLAVLRVEISHHAILHGDYFTERQSAGKLQLQRRRPNPWWVLWK